jgi:hypothetical protein
MMYRLAQKDRDLRWSGSHNHPVAQNRRGLVYLALFIRNRMSSVAQHRELHGIWAYMPYL